MLVGRGGSDRLVFVVVLVVFVLVVVVPQIGDRRLHAGAAVVRVVGAGGHGAVGAAVTTRGRRAAVRWESQRKH